MSASPAQVSAYPPASLPALDPAMRAYLEVRWRVCMTELRMIAPVLGWTDRLPQKGN